MKNPIFVLIASPNSFFSIVNSKCECCDENVFLEVEVTLRKIN